MTIEGPRVLDKVLPGCLIETSGSAEISSVTGGNWRPVVGIGGIVVQRDYFDNSGYGVGDLTMFVQGVEMQYAGPIDGTDTAIVVLEYITTELITDEEIVATLAILPGGSPFNGSGFSRSTMNQEQVIYARRRTYRLNQNLQPASPVLFTTDMWGTCNASTGDKIYITRIANMYSGGTNAFIPDVNVVLVAVIAKEKELPYLMRASRSYEATAGN